MIRFLVFAFCLGELVTGQQLRVKSANARSVQLEWTGATGPVTVERTSGITVEKTPATDPIELRRQDHQPLCYLSISGFGRGQVLQ